MAWGNREISQLALGVFGDDLWNTGGMAELEDHLADDFRNHQLPDARGGESVMDLEEWRTLLHRFHQGFSDARMEILRQVAEGDYVATRWRVTAKNVAEFAGYPATGRSCTWTGASTDRFDGGRLAETWVDWDKYTFLAGLDLV
ncbi:ester cyclase [Nocardiopsis sp. NPDC050513]|uniref:ester cyclase n=1 Tax=Nocardiopsis sp. NPDC050513 TaxID=3364338 RepID=UPI00379A4149